MTNKMAAGVLTYRIAAYFKGENFHEFHKLSSIHENFTLEMFLFSGYSTQSVKILPFKSWESSFVEIFPLKNNPLYSMS